PVRQEAPDFPRALRPLIGSPPPALCADWPIRLHTPEGDAAAMAAPEVAAALGSGPGAAGAKLPEPLGLLELCGACRQRLSPQREPRLLPCLHSVCRGCIGNGHGERNGEGMLGCPVCHQQCPLGDIMENLFLQPSPSGQSCTSCEDNASATSFCLECSEPLCATCVGAHLRVRYTREHRVQPLGDFPISMFPFPIPHSHVPIFLFPSSPVCPPRVPSMSPCVPSSRRVSDAQQRLQVEVKLAVLQAMRELNKRAKALMGDIQRVSEGRRQRLERQRRELSRARRLQEHASAPWRSTRHGRRPAALQEAQLLGALGVPLEPPEPQGELRFQWDLQGWTRSAQSFGEGTLGTMGTGFWGSQGFWGALVTPLSPRRGPPSGQGSPPRLPKQPRVSLERLELDLELDPAQPPVFRIFPGPSAQEFSLIVIEQGAQGTPGTPGTAGTEGTEEQQESPIGDTGDIGDTKPVGLLPPSPGDPGPAPGVLGVPVGVPGVLGLPVGVPGVLGLPVGVPGVSCCRVCGQAGAVVMCDRCQRCFHLHCHLPALHDVPRYGIQRDPLGSTGIHWDLLPPRCEFVLLELLCHEPCRPLQRLCSTPDGGDAMDLTLMRARLQEKLSPHYRSPEEFARDGWRLLRQFHRLTEDKADVQSILELQRFLESRLSAAFGDQKFSRLLTPISPPSTPISVAVLTGVLG
uniref:Uncharacterized protein n=1 Tax=Geospiza parvula TaxID=87175 RepID=A0A8U8BVC9_GEOPR